MNKKARIWIATYTYDYVYGPTAVEYRIFFQEPRFSSRLNVWIDKSNSYGGGISEKDLKELGINPPPPGQVAEYKLTLEHVCNWERIK